MIIAKQASQPFYKHRQQITENRDCSLKEGLMEELAQKIQFGRISVASLATFPQYSIPNTETTHNMGTWSETMRKSGRILHPREILRSTGDQIFDDAANILYGHLSIVDFLDRPTLTPAHRSAVMTHPLFIQWTNEAMELSRTLQWD